jgi:hypothetical protein
VTVVLHPPYFSLFPDWRQNRKSAILTQLRWSRQYRRRWWTPSQNTTPSTKFRKWQKLWELCVRSEGNYFEGDGGQ